MKLQDYLLKKADHPAAIWIVFFLTVCDSIFLFVPPEVFMAPPIVANKKKALAVIAAASLGSLIGGIIAYMIGMWLYDSIGVWLINTFASADQFAAAKQLFEKHGMLIIVISAVTPVPYKLITIAAGFLRFNPFLFLIVSNIFRAGRFGIFGFLVWRFQEQANAIIKKYFWPLTLLAIAAAGFGILLLEFLPPR